MFITIEGPDGAGKTTQISILEEFLKKKGRKVIRTREPGGTEIGSRIRQIILDPASEKMSSITEALLYAADRAQHVNEVIKPYLEEGFVVISDRYVDSSIAYQGCGLGLDISLIKQLCDIATSGLMPDITVLLDIDSEEGLKRAFEARYNDAKIKEFEDRIEDRDIEFHRSVRSCYLQLAKESPQRYIVLDVSKKTISQVASLITKAVDEYLTR